MKISFLEQPNKHHKYTYCLLYELMRLNNIPVVPPEEAELFLISLDDVDDFTHVKQARRIAGKRPLIAGGIECFVGNYLLGWCDALVVGEGFEFFEALGKAKSIEELYSLPYVWTKEKTRVIPSTRIDIEKLPVARLTKKSYSYLAGRGCQGKCAFCTAGFVYPRWSNDPLNLEKAARQAESGGGKITFVTNDSSELLISGMTQSIRVDRYLQAPNKYKAAMLHLGIEGFSEERRKWFGKYISDETLYRLWDVLAINRQNAEIFFILNFPETYVEMMNFAESVPFTMDKTPRFMIKLTQFNPCPQTPLWTYDMNQFEYLSKIQIKQFRYALAARNSRFKMFPIRGNARSLWRGLIRRATPEEAVLVGKDPGAAMEIQPYLEWIHSAGLAHLMDKSGYMPASQIVAPFRELRDRTAARLGMPEVKYYSDLAVQDGAR
jgi:hypothetical protein